jgi:hypothetical protein
LVARRWYPTVVGFFMRVAMGVIKGWQRYLLRMGASRLQEAVARILENGKAKQAYLKRSLATKDLREANIRAKPVLMDFDRIIARAKDQLKGRPLPLVS